MPIRGIPEVTMSNTPEIEDSMSGTENAVDKNQLTLELNLETQHETTHTTHKGA